MHLKNFEPSSGRFFQPVLEKLKHSLPIPGKATSEDIRSYLENILSEFNHLVSVLLKGDKVVKTTQILINQKIVGHA